MPMTTKLNRMVTYLDRLLPNDMTLQSLDLAKTKAVTWQDSSLP